MLVAMRLLLVCRSCYATGLSYLRAARFHMWTRVIDYKRLSATTAEVNVTYTASVAAVAIRPRRRSMDQWSTTLCAVLFFPTLQFFATVRPPVRQSGL